MSLRSRGWVARVVLNVLIDRGGCCRQCCLYVTAIGDSFKSPREPIGDRGVCGSLRAGYGESAVKHLGYEVQWPAGPIQSRLARHRLDRRSLFASICPNQSVFGTEHVVDKGCNRSRILGLLGDTPLPGTVAGLRTITEIRQRNNCQIAASCRDIMIVTPRP